MMIIASIFLHDIGMCPEEDIIKDCTLVLANLNSDFIEDISLYKVPLPAHSYLFMVFMYPVACSLIL